MTKMGFVYEWTNTVNGKKYLGSHGGSPNDSYIGSGIAFRNAVKKYGLAKFAREILYIGTDYKDIEELLLEEVDAANNKQYYNQTNKSLGASLVGSKNGMYGKKHRQETLDQISDTLVHKYASGEKRTNAEAIRGENNPMFGRTDQTRAIVARAKRNAGKTFEEIHGEKAASIRQKMQKSHAGNPQQWLPVTCPHCNMTSRGPNMTRYHFDKCKKKDHR